MGLRMTAPHILVANVFFAPFTYGGATVVAEQVARALRQVFGWRISAVSVTQRGDLMPYSLLKTECDGIANYVINLPPGRSHAELYDNPNVTEVVARLMDDLQPDLFHAHCLQDIGAGILAAAQERGIPTILSVHDFWWICERQFMIRPNRHYCGQSPVRIEKCRGCVEDHDRARNRALRLERMAAMAARVTYPSHFARDLCEASGLAPGRGIIWTNGVRLPEPGFAARQSARRASDPRVTFGFVGGPSQIKGWPVIAEAFRRPEAQGTRLILVDGSPDGSWWRNVRLNGLRCEVEIRARFAQHEMDDFYKEIDVLLFMSQWKETFGLAIREALARGIRVIQTDSGGTVEHGAADPARLIPIGAGPEALVAQLRAVLDETRGQAPAPVTSFEDQARAFADLVRTVMAEARTATAESPAVVELRRA